MTDLTAWNGMYLEENPLIDLIIKYLVIDGIGEIFQEIEILL